MRLSQLVATVNEKALELQQRGIDTYTVEVTRKGRGWKVFHEWKDGRHVTGYCDTLSELWGELETRLRMADMRLGEKTNEQ